MWLLILVAVTLLFYYFLIKPQLYWKSRNVGQGMPIPIFGDSLLTFLQRESATDMLKRAYNRNENARYIGLYQGMSPVLLLRDPELIKQIAVKDFDHFTDHRSFTSDTAEPVWSKNLFSLKGDQWREMRPTLSPAFTTSKMRTMFSLMEESAQQYVEFYMNQKQKQIKLELKDSFTRFANDVIASCAFGLNVDSLKEPENEFYLRGKDVTDFRGFVKITRFIIAAMFPNVASLFNIALFPVEATVFFKKIVGETLRMREEKNIIRPDMIHLLMEARKGRLTHEDTHDQNTGFATVQESDIGKKTLAKKMELNDDDITAQALIFFFAGFDTISTMMSFTCFQLALYPEIQARLREEVDATFKNCNGKLVYDELNKMKYMDMVICESMRMYPPILAMDRVCNKEYTIEPKLPGEKPLHLVPGDLVWLPATALHHDPKYYPNPSKFDPERFSDENKDGIGPYTFYPFGAGPRNCIGSRFALMECKTLLFHMLSKFELTVIDKTPVPFTLDATQFNPSIKGGFWVGLNRRDL